MRQMYDPYWKLGKAESRGGRGQHKSKMIIYGHPSKFACSKLADRLFYS